MAWSHAIRLRDYAAAPAPQAPGVYEIGFVRNNVFNGLYVGKATSIYGRLQKHYTGRGNQGVQDYRLRRERDHLWCHWMQVANPALTEANLLQRLGIGAEGYLFNKRLEYYRG